MRILKLLILLFTLLTASFAYAVTETGGGQKIVGNGQLAPETTFYSPSVAISPTGKNVSIFVQGSPDFSVLACGVQPLDQVLRYKHPNTWAGLTTQFWDPSAAKRTNEQRLLPNCADQTPDYAYASPASFVDVGRYFVVAAKLSKTHTTDPPYWTRFLLGTSSVPDASDNVTWSYQTLFTLPTNADGSNTDLNVIKLTLRPLQLGGSVYWWGFLYYKVTPTLPNGQESLTEVRFHLSTHSGNTADWDYYEILTTSGWQRFAKGAPMTVPGTSLARLWDDATDPSITWQTDHFELWASTYSLDSHCGCDQYPGMSTYIFGSELELRTVSPNLSSGATLQPPQGLGSTIRCMPGAYTVSRATPFRLDSSTLLYSATNEVNCPNHGYDGMYVVVTAVQ